MPTNTEARKARERRLRAKYRKKTAITAIVALVIGLIIGFVLCAISVSKPGPISRMLKVVPADSVESTPVAVVNAAGEEAGDEEGSDFIDFADGEDADLAGGEDADFAEGEDVDFAGGEDADFAEGEDADLAGGEDADFAEGEDADFAEGEDDDFAEGEDDDFAGGEDAEILAFGGEDAAGATALEAGAVEAEATPEVVATPEPTVAPQIVPFGQPMTVQTEINADGSKRTEASDQAYETLNFTLRVAAYKSPAYFQETYSTQYKLNGDEAAVQFDVTLNGYTGFQQIIPQDALLITFMGETPDVVDEGYQLMDAEIAGKTGIVVTPNTATTLYKRYSYSAAVGDMQYMVVTAYMGGEPVVYWFEIQEPEPVVTPIPEEMIDPETGEVIAIEGADASGSTGDAGASDGSSAAPQGLTIGSEGEEVSRLQRALISKGLLQGSPDGKFGNYTADAVRILQERYGMAKTGVADQAFLDRLYSDQ